MQLLRAILLFLILSLIVINVECKKSSKSLSGKKISGKKNKNKKLKKKSSAIKTRKTSKRKDYNDDDNNDESLKDENLLENISTKADYLSKGAMSLTKKSMKNAVDLLAAKHVYIDQILGVWRLSQEVEVRKDVFVSCPATIEFCKGNEVISYYNENEFVSEFIFKERSWPRPCTITFQAEAFQGPRDEEPVRMLYRGRFKKSLMNPKVIFIRGSIYKISGRLVWKSKKKVGKFKATMRRYRK